MIFELKKFFPDHNIFGGPQFVLVLASSVTGPSVEPGKGSQPANGRTPILDSNRKQSWRVRFKFLWLLFPAVDGQSKDCGGFVPVVIQTPSCHILCTSVKIML